MQTHVLRPLAIAAALAASVLISLPARAHGDAGHAAAHHGHASHGAAHGQETPFGRPGDPAQATRSVVVDMSDDMRFTPAVITVKKGETVRLNVRNKGRVLHELVLGTPEDLQRHAEAMRAMPGMPHDAPQMTHVQPGRDGDVVWQFTQAGEVAFACLLPGHFEAGMVGKVVVR